MRKMSHLTQRSEEVCICLKLGRLHDSLQNRERCLQYAYGRMHGRGAWSRRAMALKEAYQGGQIPQLLTKIFPNMCGCSSS